MNAPITWIEPSYAIFDVDQNAVCTTRWGNLAIFSVRRVAEGMMQQTAQRTGQNLIIVPVLIKPVES